MSSLPPELLGLVEQLRAKLVEIDDSEQTCMTDAVASAAQGTNLPQVQAIMARCRQSSAAAAAVAIDAFHRGCSRIDTQATTSLANAAVISATVHNVSDFWARAESSATAFASEAEALLPVQGPDKIIQLIRNNCSDRASTINRYFDQLAT